MNKSVLISTRPQWCELIEQNLKRLEVRKTRPREEPPFTCYLYETARRRAVIGEFTCDYIEQYEAGILDFLSPNSELLKLSCLSIDEIRSYVGKSKKFYAWHISDLKIYDKPRELSEFWAYNGELHKRYDSEEDFCCYNDTNEYGEALTDCGDAYNNILNCYRCWEEWSGWCHHVTRPPQSWMYVEELEE